jgi:hypothetical protein
LGASLRDVCPSWSYSMRICEELILLQTFFKQMRKSKRLAKGKNRAAHGHGRGHGHDLLLTPHRT